MRHLIVHLESPLMAFGGETIDNLGVVRPFPAASMLTGMFANALGWRRIEREAHERLQRRLVFAARIDREPAGGYAMRDFQTAQLGASDRGWTTRGRPEGRAGGAATYNSPHLRYRDYYADMRVTVALRLDSGSGAGMTAGRGKEQMASRPWTAWPPRSTNRRGRCSSGASPACRPRGFAAASWTRPTRWPRCWPSRCRTTRTAGAP